MMPPVMAQIVATLILLRRDGFVLDFLDFLLLRLYFLEHLVLLLMVLGIVLVLSFLVFLFLNLIGSNSKSWQDSTLYCCLISEKAAMANLSLINTATAME